MKEKIKKFYGTNSCKYLIILLVTIILCIPMFGNKLINSLYVIFDINVISSSI